MHIPDGYLSPQTCAVMYAAAAPFWWVALQRLKRSLSARMVPLISIFAAFSFLIMMFNLPLPGGTTGHAAGMTLAAIVLGPWGAIIAVSVALILQALFFGDGGVLAIGANCFNIAVVGSLVGYGLYRLLAGRATLRSRRRVVAGAVAGYVALNAAAFITAVEFGIQPELFTDASGAPLYSFYPLSIAIPAMMLGHLTIAGIAEAVVTGGVLAYIQRVDPSLLRTTAQGSGDSDATRTTRPRRLTPLWAGLAALVVLTPLGLLASGTAWGEWDNAEVTAEQAAYHIRELPLEDRQRLGAEFGRLAQNSESPKSIQELVAAGRAVAEGELYEAGDIVQRQLAVLRAADPARYPQIARMAAAIRSPEGLSRWSTVWTAPVPDYAPSFLRSEAGGYVISAAVGAVLVGLLAWIIGRVLAGREGTTT